MNELVLGLLVVMYCLAGILLAGRLVAWVIQPWLQPEKEYREHDELAVRTRLYGERSGNVIALGNDTARRAWLAQWTQWDRVGLALDRQRDLREALGAITLRKGDAS